MSAGLAAEEEAPWPTYAWSVSTPEEQGLDPARLEAADAFVRTNSPNRYSLLVIRNGYLVFERYYNGATAEDRFPTASMTKSFLSAVTGIAAAQGLIGTETRFHDVYPGYAQTGDPRLAELRVKHLLTMSGGLEYEQQGGTEAMTQTQNWIYWTITRPMAAAPGEVFHYSGGMCQILSGMLTRRTGLLAADFGQDRLFRPLGVTDFTWEREWYDSIGGFGINMRPRDLAKLGYLYLHDGRWDGRQIVPAAWVRDSTKPQIRSGTGPNSFYGYYWWMANVHGFSLPNAAGMGGQFIWFSRELNMVVVTTGLYSGQSGDIYQMMTGSIIPAVFRAAPRIDGVANSAGGAGTIAPDSFASVYGANLAPAEVEWGSVIMDGKTLPATLGGVSVKIGGRECYASYAGPGQVNVLAPADVPAGEADLEVRHPGGVATARVTVAPTSPGIFAVTPSGVDGYLSLWVNGLGRTAEAHPAGEALARYYAHADPSSVRVLFGDVEVAAEAVVMTFAGLWQVNVKTPELPVGPTAVRVRAGDALSPVWVHIN